MERLEELEALLEFLGPAIKALDEVTAKAAEPAERLRKLLQSQDKRETLLEMAGGARDFLSEWRQLCSEQALPCCSIPACLPAC